MSLFKSTRASMLALLALLPACGGGSGISPPPPPPAVTVKIGGTVAGLSGSLVLRNSGADDLSLGADGPFTFATALATGAAYEVTVATQPAGQTCSVAHGAGTTGSADVTDVAIACANTAAGGSGSPDLSFGTAGKVTTDFSGPPPA